MRARDSTTDVEGYSVECGCKVGEVADRRNLADISVDLKRRWTDEGDDRHSLRDLADYFNRRVLATATTDAGMNPLKGEVENLYRLLTDEETTSGDRLDARHRLEYEGVAVDELRDDFVTHQTVYRHLKNCLDAEYHQETDPATRLDRDTGRIDAFQNRLRVVVEEIVRRLDDAELFRIASPRVYVDVQIVCEDCGTQYSPRELVGARGCDCSDDD